MLTSTTEYVNIYRGRCCIQLHFHFYNYRWHLDYFQFGRDGTETFVKRRNRYISIIITIIILYNFPSSYCMSDNRLKYYCLKFENEVLARKQEPKCRIWNNEELQHIIDQLCDPSGTYPRAHRSLKQFQVLTALGVNELRYLGPYNNDESLKIVAFNNLFDILYWAWEQIGFSGWKPFHKKIRGHGYYISIVLLRLFL